MGEVCPKCGTREEEWGEWTVDRTGRRVFLPFFDPDYEPVVKRCYGCQEIERTQAQRTKSVPAHHNYGIRVILRVVEGVRSLWPSPT